MYIHYFFTEVLTADLWTADKADSTEEELTLGGAGVDVLRRPWVSKACMRLEKDKADWLTDEMSAPSAWTMAERSWMASLVADKEGGVEEP